MQNFNVDISSPGGPLVFYAMQADSLSRFFTLTITDNGEAWNPPSGALWSVRFGAPQMPSGWYDTITEVGGGTHPAIDVFGNVATVEIAEQALESPGKNTLCVLVTDSSGYQIASWPIIISIQAVPGLTAPEVTNYYNLLTAQVAQAFQNAQNAATSATAAANSAELSESWAVGGTGSRAGEDTNNSKYWAQQSQKAANNRVASFNGRTGAVMPKAGDYDAADVGALALTGGTVRGTTVFQNGIYAHQKATDGTPAKYLQIATITITASVVDVPIEFILVKRDYTESAKLSIKFEIAQTADPDLQSFTFSGYVPPSIYAFAMVKTAPGVWAVYASVLSTFDSFSVAFVNTDWVYLKNRATITLGGETTNSLPASAVYATFSNFASATRMLRTTRDVNTFPEHERVKWDETSSTTSHAPGVNGFYHILSGMGQDQNFASQFAVGMNVAALLHRYKASNVWSDWARVYTTAFKPSPSDIGALAKSSGLVLLDSGSETQVSIPAGAIGTKPTNVTIPFSTDGTPAFGYAEIEGMLVGWATTSCRIDGNNLVVTVASWFNTTSTCTINWKVFGFSN